MAQRDEKANRLDVIIRNIPDALYSLIRAALLCFQTTLREALRQLPAGRKAVYGSCEKSGVRVSF